MLRRALFPVILCLIVVSSGTIAVRADVEPEPRAPLGAASPATPVLSARRVPSLLAQPVGDRRLVAALEQLAARLPGASCLLVEQGGRRLFARNETLPLIGASTQKLLTAGAALDRLGREKRLATVVAARGRSGAVVDGDLWMIGGGDSLLGTADYAAAFERQPQVRTAVEELADRVVRSGVRQVRGRVVGDDSRYDAQRYVASWRALYIADNDSGPLSALSVNHGFDVIAGPQPRLQEDNVPSADPPASAAATFTRLLRERGVTVDGEAVSGRAPDGLTEVARIESPDMATVVAHMLRESDNTTAELLLKELGRSEGRAGTTAAGAQQVVAAVAEAGAAGDGIVVVDGSGLDRGNRVTCQALVGILSRAGRESDLGRGLAVAGRSGTLTRRFLDTPVAGRLQAKTGSLFDVAALAGFVEGHSGSLLTFALVTNELPILRTGFDLQDELAHLLVQYPNVPDLAGLGPTPHH